MVKAVQAPKRREQSTSYFRFVSYFDQRGVLEPTKVEGVPILVPGKIGDVPVVQLPGIASPEHVARISKAIHEACGIAPIVTSTNVLILRLEKISDAEAHAQIKKHREQLAQASAEEEAARAAAAPDVVQLPDSSDGDGPVAHGNGLGDHASADQAFLAGGAVDGVARPGELDAAQEGQ